MVHAATPAAYVHSNMPCSSGHWAIIIIPYNGVKGTMSRKRSGMESRDMKLSPKKVRVAKPPRITPYAPPLCRRQPIMMPIAAVESDLSKVRMRENAHILASPPAVVVHPTARTARMSKRAEVMDEGSLLAEFVVGSTGVRTSWCV